MAKKEGIYSLGANVSRSLTRLLINLESTSIYIEHTHMGTVCLIKNRLGVVKAVATFQRAQIAAQWRSNTSNRLKIWFLLAAQQLACLTRLKRFTSTKWSRVNKSNTYIVNRIVCRIFFHSLSVSDSVVLFKFQNIVKFSSSSVDFDSKSGLSL